MTNNLTQNTIINESISDLHAEQIAKSLEFMLPLFIKLRTTGNELIRIIGNGQESNNHYALVTFVKKQSEKLIELPSIDHVRYVSEQLEVIFEHLKE